MGHHYLPRFYLRGFTTGNTVWVHDRRERRSYPSQPKSVANENKLYSEDIEQHLANAIEDPAKSAIEALRLHQPLDEQQREALAHYVIALWKRVPEGRARVYSGVPEVADSIRQELHAELDATVAATPHLADLAEHRKAQVSEVIEKFKIEPPPEVWHQNLTRDSSPNVVAALLSMNWRVLISEGADFLTSDNPVFFFQNEGIGRPTSELSVPLSSTVVLWAHRRPAPGPLYFTARPEAVRGLNRRVVFNATRYVYSQRLEPWMLRFVCKTDHVLTRFIEQ
ncbi:DUF4238 domain-containing protein [Ideonella sp. B508-1]|uniref:DUF4238 domain-containing protein n=1 Tax=Ideonella sp. B508-1 TaxID=137716 RepID=UPI000A01E5B9|nr:DUF4238 domain-containing protein [Ideonella sp. B508-1]